MKCPHCYKEIETGYEQTSPQMLLLHLKGAQTKAERDFKSAKEMHPNDPTGYVKRKAEHLEKWKAWTQWVEEQIYRKGGDKDGS